MPLLMIKLLFNTATPVKMSSQQVLMVLFKKNQISKRSNAQIYLFKYKL